MDCMPFTKIVTLTDIHILPDNRLLIGIDPTERLRLAIDHINRTQSDAELCVITGDLTHKGDPDSYAILKRELAKLRIPVRILVGNHDIRENFRAAFRDADDDGNGFVQFAADLAGWRLIGLDPLHGPPYVYPDSHAGVLCGQRIAFLKSALESADGRPILIFMHHPPFDTGFPGMDRIKLWNHEEFRECLSGHDVRQIICGHIHRTISASWGGIPATIMKSLVDQMPFDLVTVDSSLATLEPPAYGVLLLNDHTVLCHSVEFLSELPEGQDPASMART
jgi:3',5'-cyclic-AMP phosphodiesterase